MSDTPMSDIDIKDWQPLEYVPQQSELWATAARFVCVVAGRQSGKSLLCFRKIILAALERKGRYIYVLPTVNQARKVCWARMTEMLKPLQSEVAAMNKSELAFYFKNGSILTLESGEKRERIEGISITGAIIDESSDQLPGLFDLTVLPAMARIPDSWCWRVGVPKSNGVGGQDFKEACDKYRIFAENGDSRYASIHWSYADKSFREILRKTLDEKGFKEQSLGLWQTYAGGCYYAFSDDNIMDEEYKINPALPILFGFDFNVDWYSVTAAQYDGGVYYVFDEVRLKNANTRTALDTLVARFGSLAKSFIAYGDAAGRQRQTSADISDYLAIENEKRIPMKVIFPKSNPSVVYRIEQVNSFLKTADNYIRLKIAPKCRYLIKDLFAITWKEGGSREQDKRNPELTHMADALGYMLIHHNEHYGENRVSMVFGDSTKTELPPASIPKMPVNSLITPKPNLTTAITTVGR